MYPVLVFIAANSFYCEARVTPEKYLNEFDRQKERLATKIIRNSVTASILYMPATYFAARDLKLTPSRSPAEAKKQYENSLFFALGIKADSQSNGASFLLTRGGYAEFKANVMTNNFRRGDEIFLLHENDTVRPAGVQYDRNWGLMAEDQFIITFARNQIKSDVRKYHLIIREMAPELGTLDIKIRSLKIKPETRLSSTRKEN